MMFHDGYVQFNVTYSSFASVSVSCMNKSFCLFRRFSNSATYTGELSIASSIC